MCKWNIIVEESEDAQCWNWDGNHIPHFPECHVMVKEVKVERIRAVEKVSYAEAVKMVEAASRDDEAVAVVTQQSVDVSQLMILKY